MDKKLLGYFCCHIPVELISASGVKPYYINGLGSFSEKSYSYLPGNFCIFAKNCLNQGLTLPSDTFGGAVFSNSCDSMERLYDIWKHYLPFSFIYLLEVPRKRDEVSYEYFHRQIKNFKYALEKYFQCDISDNILKKYIEVYNKSRKLFKEISLLRINTNFYIPSSKIFHIINLYREPEKLNSKLEKILNSKESFYMKDKKSPRLLLSGSVMELTLVNLIENTGAAIVYEDFCSFNRPFEELIDPSLPPLDAISKRYFNKNSCARKKGSLLIKLKKLKELIKNYNIDGIIFYLIKFCDIFSWEIYMLVSELRKEEIPVLVIEGDYPVKTKGQTGTRIEAFIEMLGDDI